MAQPFFRTNAVRDLVVGFAAACDHLSLRWDQLAEQGATIDVGAEMRRLTLDIVGRTLFGVDLPTTATQVGDAIEALQELAFRQVMSPGPGWGGRRCASAAPPPYHRDRRDTQNARRYPVLFDENGQCLCDSGLSRRFVRAGQTPPSDVTEVDVQIPGFGTFPCPGGWRWQRPRQARTPSACRAPTGSRSTSAASRSS